MILLLSAGPVLADPPEPATITMAGLGTVSGTPDIAVVSLGVRTEAEQAAAALNSNSDQMRGLLAAIASAGIGKADVATSAVTLEPRIVYPEDDRSQPRITGYSARNAVTVRVRDLAKLGPLLQGAVAGGGNELSGLSYDFVDRAPLTDEARKAAVADARRKAETIAAAAGIKLGRILRIAETVDGGYMPAPRMLARKAAADVPVETGTMDVSANISITWEIAP